MMKKTAREHERAGMKRHEAREKKDKKDERAGMKREIRKKADRKK